MTYIKLKIHITEAFQEQVIAELADLGFDGFQQLEEAIIIYQPKEQFPQTMHDRVENILNEQSTGAFIELEEEVVQQNWNEQWEQTLEAQTIGPFFVKPTWVNQQARKGQILIEIDPKMAFGTGYHPTTRLPLCSLPDLVKKGDHVLDAGTGTGILAIAAAKLGAAQVTAFEIDAWSLENARENIKLNKVGEAITLLEGSTHAVPDDAAFDVILANIERNTLLGMLSYFADHLIKGGQLYLSGLLAQDREVMTESLHQHQFKVIETMQEKNWVGLWASK